MERLRQTAATSRKPFGLLMRFSGSGSVERLRSVASPVFQSLSIVLLPSRESESERVRRDSSCVRERRLQARRGDRTNWRADAHERARSSSEKAAGAAKHGTPTRRRALGPSRRDIAAVWVRCR